LSLPITKLPLPWHQSLGAAIKDHGEEFCVDIPSFVPEAIEPSCPGFQIKMICDAQ